MENNLKLGLEHAIVTILTPLMRALIHYDVPVSEFSELARQAYVDAAFTHFGTHGRKMTFARAADLTGLSRKEVARISRLRNLDDEPSRMPLPNRAQQVIQGWSNDPEYLTIHGYPRVLPYMGTSRSFAALVSRYGAENTPCAILKELLCSDAVFRDHRGNVHLNKLGHMPQANQTEKIHSMAECVADLLNTAVRNIESHDTEQLFQRQLVYTDVPVDAAERFRPESEKLSAKYLQQINRLLATVRSDSVCCNERRRVGFGIYYIEAPSTSEEAKRNP